ncbi:MAG: hypothetical protein LBG84_08115 [Treponema sp.]|jgi:hypothetical protein|nr:hypothetical protein [Treponema sp.]
MAVRKKKAGKGKELVRKLQLKILIGTAVPLIGAVCVVAALRSAGKAPAFQTGASSRKPAGTVNGDPFFQEDLDVYAAELRAGVAANYGREYGVSHMGAAFWDTKYGDSTPRETLYKLALERLIRNMVLLQEARGRGVDAPSSYRELESERENRNNPGGGMVYGPEELAPAEFNSYRIGGITDELKTILLKNELAPTARQLRGAFDSLPDEMKRAPYLVSGIRFYRADDPAPAGDAAASPGAAALKTALEKSLKELSPEEAAKNLRLSREEFTIDSRYISKEDSRRRELAGLLENAVPGDIAALPGGSEWYYVIKKEGGGAFSFEEAPGLGISRWINDQFEIFLDQRVQAAKVIMGSP